MKILVTAPTSSIGRRVLRELLAPEFSIRVLARDAAQLPEDVFEEIEVLPGSADDAAALTNALDGIEALFWCMPAESLHETNVRGHYERFARAATVAIREAGTPRVVSISADGKGLARNAGPISGLHAMEDILNESGAAIRHLRWQFSEAGEVNLSPWINLLPNAGTHSHSNSCACGHRGCGAEMAGQARLERYRRCCCSRSGRSLLRPSYCRRRTKSRAPGSL